MKKILVAMSGGVDSSVTAAMMVDAGYDVTGITMRLGAPDTIEVEPERPNCCSLEGIEDARRVATQLGIPFYGVNYEDAFREQVITISGRYRLFRGRIPHRQNSQSLYGM